MKSLRNLPKLHMRNNGSLIWIPTLVILLSAWGATPALSQAVGNSVPPSNKQLASPQIEQKVNALLKKMTLEEKLGQLVQYSDNGYSRQAQTAEEAANPGKNPTAPHP